MYFTTGSYIKYGAMDGSNLASTSSGFSTARGMTVDIHSSRLYFHDDYNSIIRSSRLDFSDMNIVAQPSRQSYGIVLVEQRLYWGLHYENRVESKSTAGGGDTTSVYIGGNGRIRDLTSPDWSLAANQTNPCAGQTCSGVCVLTRTHYRCMARAG